MLPDHRIGSRKPQAGTRLLGGKIRVEYFLEVLLRNTNAGVLYCDFHIPTILQGQSSGTGYREIDRVHLNGASGRHGLNRVNDQVVNDLVNLPLIHVDMPKILRNGEIAEHLGPAQRKHHRVDEEFGYG